VLRGCSSPYAARCLTADLSHTVRTRSSWPATPGRATGRLREIGLEVAPLFSAIAALTALERRTFNPCVGGLRPGEPPDGRTTCAALPYEARSARRAPQASCRARRPKRISKSPTRADSPDLRFAKRSTPPYANARVPRLGALEASSQRGQWWAVMSRPAASSWAPVRQSARRRREQGRTEAITSSFIRCSRAGRLAGPRHEPTDRTRIARQAGEPTSGSSPRVEPVAARARRRCASRATGRRLNQRMHDVRTCSARCHRTTTSPVRPSRATSSRPSGGRPAGGYLGR